MSRITDDRHRVRRFCAGRRFPALLVLALGLATPAWAADDLQDLAATHEITRLLLQLGVIVLAAKLGGALARRLGLPELLGEVGIGLGLGPFALGSLPIPGFPDGLIPLAEGAFPVALQLYGFAAVGAVIHVLQVGLESDPSAFGHRRRMTLPISIGSSVLSLLVGALVPVLFLGLPLVDRRTVFFAALSVSTSLGIQARILHSHHKIASPEGAAIVSSSLVQDGVAIVFLAIALAFGGLQLGREGDAGFASVVLPVALLAAAVLAGGGLLAFRGAPRLSRFFQQSLTPNLYAVVVVGMTLLVSAVFEAFGVASIIGAYIIGIAFSRTDIGDALADKTAPISEFFVPILYVVLGMLVDWRVLLDPGVLLPGLGFALVSGFAKVVGAGVPALSNGFTAIGALRVGLGTVCRGEVALIIASVGLALGDFSAQIFQIMMVMIVASVGFGAPLLSVAVRSPLRGTRGNWAEREMEDTSISLPNEELSDLITDGLLRVAEEDGFFVHRLELQGTVYRLRRDEVFLTVNRGDTSIHIQSSPQDVGIARTMLYEVIVHVRDRITRFADLAVPKELRRDAAGGGSTGVNLADYLSEDAAVVPLASTEKHGAIAELVDALARTGRISDPEQVLRDVMERESSVSTGMERGLAIPHARTEGVSGIVVAVGLSHHGLDFSSLDGQPSRLIFLIASPPHDRAPHLQLLAAIARQMRNADRMQAAMSAVTGSELVDAIVAPERMIGTR